MNYWLLYTSWRCWLLLSILRNNFLLLKTLERRTVNQSTLVIRRWRKVEPMQRLLFLIKLNRHTFKEPYPDCASPSFFSLLYRPLFCSTIVVFELNYLKPSIRRCAACCSCRCPFPAKFVFGAKMYRYLTFGASQI